MSHCPDGKKSESMERTLWRHSPLLTLLSVDSFSVSLILLGLNICMLTLVGFKEWGTYLARLE